MRILVIKLAALGDMVQAFPSFRRIRAAHPEAELHLLTTPPFVSLAKASGLFDRIDADGRPRTVLEHLKLFARLRRERYDLVYDLQTSERSSGYFYALWPRQPAWSGIAKGCSLPHANPKRDFMHTLEREAEQLKFAGLWPDAPTAPGTAPPPDLAFMFAAPHADQQPAAFGLKAPYALLVPGASPLRPLKRWPAERYGVLARDLAAAGMQVAVVGGPGEAAIAEQIQQLAPKTISLCGRTDFAQVAALGDQAALCVGNDTGPTHLIAAAGAPTLVLFGEDSDPALCAPRGNRVRVVQRDPLATLEPETVLKEAHTLSIA